MNINTPIAGFCNLKTRLKTYSARCSAVISFAGSLLVFLPLIFIFQRRISRACSNDISKRTELEPRTRERNSFAVALPQRFRFIDARVWSSMLRVESFRFAWFTSTRITRDAGRYRERHANRLENAFCTCESHSNDENRLIQLPKGFSKTLPHWKCHRYA